MLSTGAGQPVNNGTYVGQQTVFLRNEATRDGGAVECSGEVVIEAAWFQDNKAGRHGGAIDVFGSTSKLSTSPAVSLSFFKTNSTAGGNGGAINIAGGTHSLANTGFVGNDAQADTTAAGGIITGVGGAIYSGGGTTSLTGCSFNNNTAGTNTAVGVRGGSAALGIDNSHVTIQNLTMGVNNKTKTGQATNGVTVSPSGWVTNLHGNTWDSADTPTVVLPGGRWDE